MKLGEEDRGREHVIDGQREGPGIVHGLAGERIFGCIFLCHPPFQERRRKTLNSRAFREWLRDAGETASRTEFDLSVNAYHGRHRNMKDG